MPRQRPDPRRRSDDSEAAAARKPAASAAQGRALPARAPAQAAAKAQPAAAAPGPRPLPPRAGQAQALPADSRRPRRGGAGATPQASAAGAPGDPAARAAEPVGAWLLKSEPEVFSFSDLLASPGRRTGWDGVRNYQARNFMRDRMQLCDLVLYYHSNSAPPALVGTARVVALARPDPTQFDPRSEHFDPDSDPSQPRWLEVEIEAERALPRPVTLEQLRAESRLAGLQLLARGNRLSVLPVSPEHLGVILELAQASPEPSRKSQKSAKTGPPGRSQASSRAPRGPSGGDKT